MKIALCNEVLRPLPFPEQCRVASALGYDALELAPFTLTDDPLALSGARAAQMAGIARDHGLVISGLHWLLVAPPGLSIVAADQGLRERTVRLLEHLVELCPAFGARYLVHGSPKQRSVPAGSDRRQAWERARDCFSQVARRAEACQVVYCLEPLSRRETDFVNTVEEAVRMVTEIDSAAFKTMIDCSSAGQVEAEPVADLVRHWMPTGHIAHVQVNDPNRRGPGQGDMAFGPILRSIVEMQRMGHYHGIVAVEPFDYRPDGPGCAAYSLGYLRGILQEIAYGS